MCLLEACVNHNNILTCPVWMHIFATLVTNLSLLMFLHFYQLHYIYCGKDLAQTNWKTKNVTIKQTWIYTSLCAWGCILIDKNAGRLLLDEQAMSDVFSKGPIGHNQVFKDFFVFIKILFRIQFNENVSITLNDFKCKTLWQPLLREK